MFNIGQHFANECLRQFENNYEKTVNAILEDRLPARLKRVRDRKNWTPNQSSSVEVHVPHINTSTHQHINTSTHHHINTSTHQHIITSTHQHINTSTHQHITTSTHQHINTSTHQHINTSTHVLMC